MNKVYILTALCLLVTANKATAQKQRSPKKRYPMHELSVSLSGGHSNLLYKLDGGSHSGGFGGNIDVGYTYNVKRLFGIVTGIGISMYGSKLNMDECSEGYTGTDDVGDDFTLNYSLTGYTERQRVVLFTVPLMAKFSKPVGEKGWTSLFVAGGVKLGIPVSAKASISAQTVTTSGHYVFEGVTYEGLPPHGFVTGQAGEQSDYEIKLKPAGILALETGIRLRAGYQKHVMASIYLDYSLNSIQKVSNRHVLEYQPSNPPLFLYNSVINTVMIKKANLFAVGLKVGLSF